MQTDINQRVKPTTNKLLVTKTKSDICSEVTTLLSLLSNWMTKNWVENASFWKEEETCGSPDYPSQNKSDSYWSDRLDGIFLRNFSQKFWRRKDMVSRKEEEYMQRLRNESHLRSCSWLHWIQRWERAHKRVKDLDAIRTWIWSEVCGGHSNTKSSCLLSRHGAISSKCTDPVSQQPRQLETIISFIDKKIGIENGSNFPKILTQGGLPTRSWCPSPLTEIQAWNLEIWREAS